LRACHPCYGGGPDLSPRARGPTWLSRLPFSVPWDGRLATWFDAELKAAGVKMSLGPALFLRVFRPLLSRSWIQPRVRGVSRAAIPPEGSGNYSQQAVLWEQSLPGTEKPARVLGMSQKGQPLLWALSLGAKHSGGRPCL